MYISLITLGVDDMPRARTFYERLGFVAHATSNANVTFFQAGAIALSLYGREPLAEDATLAAAEQVKGFATMSIAHNVASEAEVDEALAKAVAAGARLVKRGQKVFWGGYSGYFADPDGHLWEVAYNPFTGLSADGGMVLP